MYPFCCAKMNNILNDLESPIEYKAYQRLYLLVSIPKGLRKKNEACIGFKIQYCPWCSVKLPSSLADVWCDLIEQECKVSSFDKEQFNHLPEEFKTDEWWKKRGL